MPQPITGEDEVQTQVRAPSLFRGIEIGLGIGKLHTQRDIAYDTLIQYHWCGLVELGMSSY